MSRRGPADQRRLALCTESGQSPALAALEGGLAARGCPADTEPVRGASAGREGEKPFDVDPQGVGVFLCMRRMGHDVGAA